MEQRVKAEGEIWFQKEVRQMLQQDRAAPPPQGAIVLTGSSILRCWITLERDLAPLPVVNRAFGGACTWEVLYYMDKLILPLAPSIIVYYCGSNDLEYGSAPEAVGRRFSQFCTRVHERLPGTQIFFLSINKAPQKSDKWALIDAANSMVEKLCAQDPACEFIDINPPFFDPRGLPRRGLFISDGLHFMPDAYRELTGILKPVLVETWRNLHGNPNRTGAQNPML